MPPELELCVDQVFLRRDAQLLEPPGLVPREVLLPDIRERRPAPEPERVTQQLDPPGGIRIAARPSTSASKRLHVDAVARHGKPVAGRLRDENVPTDQLAQRRDGVLQRAGRRRGRAFAPEVGNEPVGRDHLTGAKRQRGEQRTLLPARQRDDPVAVPDLQRAEEADLHRRVVTPRTSKANRSDERGVIAA